MRREEAALLVVHDITAAVLEVTLTEMLDKAKGASGEGTTGGVGDSLEAAFVVHV